MAVWVVGHPNHGLTEDETWHAVHSKSFDTQMKASRLHYCKNCNEQRITTKNMVSGAPCVLCAADSNRAFKFSKKNLMDVGSVDILFAQASVIEEQLVTVYRAAFQVILLPNKHRRFPGHTITFPQAVGSWAVSLPWTMAEVKKSNMIVRSAMEGAEGVVKVADFAVRAEFVLRLIVLLKSVHPELYCGVGDPRAQALADMQKDNWLEELLVSVPDTTDFGTEGAGPAPQQHADSAAASAPDVVDNPWVFARGSGVAVPPATNLSGEFWKAVGAAMKDRLEFGSDGTGRNEEPLVNWPQQASAPLMESKYGAVVGAMPLRFGHTHADLNNQIRPEPVSRQEYFDHLLWVWDPIRKRYPLQSHPQFAHFAGNNITRWKALSTAQGFVKDLPAGFSSADLAAQLEADNEFTLANLYRRAACIKGSTPYWMGQRTVVNNFCLWALHKFQRVVTFFHTQSYPEHHDPDLHRMLDPLLPADRRYHDRADRPKDFHLRQEAVHD